MDGEFVGDVLTAAGGFDGIDVTDHIGDGDVRSGEFLDVALAWGEPRDGSFLAHFGQQVAGIGGDGMKRIVMDLAAGHVRNIRIEQGGQHAD